MKVPLRRTLTVNCVECCSSSVRPGVGVNIMKAEKFGKRALHSSQEGGVVSEHSLARGALRDFGHKFDDMKMVTTMPPTGRRGLPHPTPCSGRGGGGEQTSSMFTCHMYMHMYMCMYM